jgi:hypothetical protein
VCFPTGYLSNLVFVSCPITLSIVLNTIALIRIMIYVTRNSITMSHVRKTNSFQEGQVYLRMCVISGIFWIMGILGAFFQSTIIDYVFIVLCSLQGWLEKKFVDIVDRNYHTPQHKLIILK